MSTPELSQKNAAQLCVGPWKIAVLSQAKL